MEKIVLKAANIHKTFHYPVKTSILKGVDLSVAQGETVAIMGRSGEGKSTLLHILGTLEKASFGTLEISGKDTGYTKKTDIRAKHIGFVFQSFHLLDDYSVLDNVLMPARIARRATSKGAQAYKNAEQLLERVGLLKRANYNAKLLSGGEKQRVAIARALCNDPDLILADEPSGNLDRQSASIIQELLFSFAKDSLKSLIIVTHDQELANFCDTQYRLRDGVLELS